MGSASRADRPGTDVRLGALDGLRGIAVLIVVASHLSNSGFLPTPGLAGSGKSGVYLFFVLSAFLLARPLLRLEPPGFASAGLWAAYAVRRVLRIWPLYLIVLGLSWMLTSAGVQGWHYHMDAAALLRHLTLREGQSVLWSIPVEFTFYLWLPLIVFGLALLRGRRWWGAAGLIVAGTVATVLWPPSAALENDIRLGPYLVVFLCGVFAAWVHSRLPAGDGRHLRMWILLGTAAALAWLATLPSVMALWSGEGFVPGRNHRWFLLFGAMWSVLLLAALHGPAWFTAALRWSPLRAVGLVSYSIYLWHMPVLAGVQAAGVRGAVGLLIALAGTAVVATLSYAAIERPLQRVRWPRSWPQ